MANARVKPAAVVDSEYSLEDPLEAARAVAERNFAAIGSLEGGVSKQ